MMVSSRLSYSLTMVSHAPHRPRSIFLKGFFSGLLGLSGFYFLLLFVITGDLRHPITQFMQFQPWMSLLIVGFGIQMGLFWLMHKGIQFNFQQKNDSKMTTSTSTAVSGLAMVACCAHHAVDLLPILGLSTAALFLSEYQEQFLIFGMVVNGLGIGMMLWFITGRPKMSVVFNPSYYKHKKEL